MPFLVCSITVAIVILAYAAAENKTGVIQERECPLLCVCTGNTIRCSRMTSFPDLPMETVEFHITNSTLSYVPMNVFLKLPSLERIAMSHMSIGTLRACSFAEIENVTEIVFRNVQIRVMEENAFSNLMNVTKISFEDSVISEMRSYSIHGAAKIGSLTFIRTNITTLQPYSILKIDNVSIISFESCNIQRFRYRGVFNIKHCSDFVIKDSQIDNWQCGSLDAFAGNTTSISVMQSIFRCDCKLAWLWKESQEESVISEESNRCLISGNRLSTLTVDDICPDIDSRKKGCAPLLPSTPRSCSRSFDNPILPEDKVDYSDYFSPQANGCSHEKFTFLSIGMSLFLTLSTLNLQRGIIR